MAAVAATLARDRGAIVLVPEIALTPQIVARFRARFGDTVAVLHSGLTVAERRGAWLALRHGEARICVGPRSAVFAPLDPLGLLVIDEEHDGSYKNEGDPGYDARRVAELRAGAAGVPLVLGSATPRPESVAGDAVHLRLSHRVDDRPLPPVELLDMRGARHPLHPRTHAALGDVRARGEKAIVLLNRRGWSNFLSCRECGHAWICDRCDVTLVLHRRDATLACHHCGRREPVPERCTACGSTAIGRHGAGTERIEHELTASLGAPDFPIVRLDADTTGPRGRLDALLAQFAAAPAGILLGTQLVAKGHDFPDVALAVVIDADAALRFPDFRAEERTFALVAQLAGRAGRGTDARVLVQTLVPDAPAIARAAHHDSDGFLAGELERRRAVGYPPFAHMVRVVCSSERPGAADAAAQALREAIDLPGERVLGPAPLFRLRGRERSQVVVRAGDRRRAAHAVGAAVAAVAGTPAGRRAAISVDVDPR